MTEILDIDIDAEAEIVSVSDAFARIFTAVTTIEMPQILHELGPADLDGPGAVEWFLTAQSHRLTVRLMAYVRTKLASEWRVPVHAAADTFNELGRYAELGYRLILSGVAAAGRAGGDTTRAYADALAHTEYAIRERSAAVVRGGLLGDLVSC